MNIIIFGGAGFIGSYLVEYFLQLDDTDNVVVYDNFSSGNYWHLSEVENDNRLIIIEKDINYLPSFNCDLKFDFLTTLEDDHPPTTKILNRIHLPSQKIWVTPN